MVCEFEFDRFMIDYINQVIRFSWIKGIKVISGHLYESED